MTPTLDSLPRMTPKSVIVFFRRPRNEPQIILGLEFYHGIVDQQKIRKISKSFTDFHSFAFFNDINLGQQFQLHLEMTF